MRLEVYYNRKSSLGPGWSSGSQRFGSWEAINTWLTEVLKEGPILITHIQEV